MGIYKDVVELCKDVLLIAFGAMLGFVFGFLADVVRRALDRCEKRKRTKELLDAILEEAKEGVSRCEGLAEGRAGTARIYISLWEASCAGLGQEIEALKAPEILRLLHTIYYRFDLVNFNMERGNDRTARAFAKEYIGDMRTNLAELVTAVAGL